MGLLTAMRQNNLLVPYINTGTLFDLATGQFRQGVDGKWILDGGLPPCLGIVGRSQTYKSGLAGSFMARAMVINKNSEGYVSESEGNVPGPERYDDFVSEPVSNRLVFKTFTTTNLTEAYEDFNQIVEEKLKHKKDYMVESPFLDPNTMKPYKVWIPTFYLMDSFSRARSGKGDKQFDDNGIDDSGMNTFWLSEGNIKTRIMNDLPSKAAKAGIYVIMTAHVGDKQDLDPYNKSPKQLQYMKNMDKMKNVGASFEFLTTSLLQTVKASVLQDSNKKCEFPCSFSTDYEVNQVDTTVVRCKNNASGFIVPFIVSQYQGILDTVTNFMTLRKLSNNYGLQVEGNNAKFTPDIYKKTFTRKNLRELSESDYKLRRALEILAQLCYIQTLWSTWKLPPYIKTKPEQLAEWLDKSTNMTTDRVLTSTGNWSTSKQERERLTIMDILSALSTEFNKK